MRIAQLSRMLPRSDYAGGVSGQVDLLARALSARGHDVTVFAVNPPAEPADYAFSPVTIPASFTRATPFLFPLALARLQLEDFDIIHSHGDDHLIRTSAPIVRTFHGWSWAETKNAVRLRHRLYHLSMGLFERISEWRADEVVVDAAETTQYLRRKAQIVPCGYSGSRFFPSGEKSGKPSILFVGDLDTRKRGRLLVDVFQQVVRPAVPDAELWIVSSDRIEAEGVRCLGRLSGDDLAKRYREAWLFCLPSSYEGFGVPYIEAMASGTPVVATPNGGAEDVLGDGKYGVLVHDAQLGKALVSLLQSSDQRAKLAEKGIERARAYSMDRLAERYEQIYGTL